jgi:hypothetical protein
MFCKLNTKFDNLLYTEGTEKVSYGGIISYLDLSNLNKNILDILPKNYHNLFTVSLMKINNEVPPHTDSGAKVVINFYIKAGNYKTSFYEGNAKSYQVENQTNGKVFEKDGLIPLSSFVAKDGDVYCLDVDKIHGVDCLDQNPSERIAVCISSDSFNYDQVCNMLMETNAINERIKRS